MNAGFALRHCFEIGTTIGPTSYILNFSGHGILVSGGHEVMIQETWLGETNFDHKFDNAKGRSFHESIPSQF